MKREFAMLTQEETEDLERQALAACKHVPGYALPFHAPIVRDLERRGLVEIICCDPLEGGLYYAKV